MESQRSENQGPGPEQLVASFLKEYAEKKEEFSSLA
jgi:hypothetical protein